MFNWLKELLELRVEFKERLLRLEEEKTTREKVCSSCEILKIELENSHREKRDLLSRILSPTKEPERIQAPEPMEPVNRPRRHIPWSIKQQALEAEDRAKAVALRNAAQPDTSVEDLEKELDLATHVREQQSGATKNSG